MKYDVYLVTYGEIWLKSEKSKKELLRLLVKNLKKKGITNIDLSERGFIIIREKGKETLEKLRKTFGVQRIYPAIEIKTDWNVIKEAVYKIAREIIKPNMKFRITAKRAYKEFPLTSYEIQKELGSLITWGNVDLKNYDVEIVVNIRKNRTFVYWESYNGPGGLPVGSEGQALALVSGGLDSPVAAWLAMKRGIKITMLYFNPFDEFLDKNFYNLYLKLREWDPDITLLTVPFSEVLLEIITKISEGFRQVVLKRVMYRLAELLADKLGCKAIILGESIGQKSSQTLDNLYVIQKVIRDKLVLRPLLGWDKEEIVKKSIDLGFYEFSIRIPDVCKLEDHSLTKTNEKEIINEEKKLDINYKEIISRTKPAESLSVVDINGLINSQKIEGKSFRKVWYTEIGRIKEFKEPLLIVCPYGYTAFSLSLALRRRGIEAIGVGKYVLAERKKE